MESQKNLNVEINAVTQKIQNEFPELIKYLDEIPELLLWQTNEGVSNKGLKDYLDSLNDIVETYAKEHESETTNSMTMKHNEEKGKLYGKESKKKSGSTVEGYPEFPPKEDIYNQAEEETDINAEDITKSKAPNEKEGTRNEKDFEEDMSGDDLDVPGSELDE
jgi:hypothetical protein